MKCINQTLNLYYNSKKMLLSMCVSFYSLFICIPAYANVYFKTTIIRQNAKMILIADLPSSQVLPDYLITAPPSVCVPDVLGVRVD